jgi:hypothetical protein
MPQTNTRKPTGFLLHDLITLLNLPKTVRSLQAPGSSATLNRLFQSEHVRDLKLIAGVAIWIMVLGAVVVLAAVVQHLIGGKDAHFADYVEAHFQTLAGIIGISGLVIAWVYRTASLRLGVVDLFASEITTLCRVGTIVGMVQHAKIAIDHEPMHRPGDPSQSRMSRPNDGPPNAASSPDLPRFTSEENYFPVFTTNSRDLEVLEADVVSHVAAFYTYMKVLRDYYRRASSFLPDSENFNSIEWHETWRNIIYMQFLAYEAAREAVKHLIEYEPTHAENTIVILLSELVAYDFLLTCFDANDVRYKRLALRGEEYRAIANTLERKMLENYENPLWAKSRELWDELVDRFSTLHIKVRKFSETDIAVIDRIANTGVEEHSVTRVLRVRNENEQ